MRSMGECKMSLSRSALGVNGSAAEVLPAGNDLKTARSRGRVRGSLIRALIDTYETDHGERAHGRLLADLSAESRTICLQGIMESGWYPQRAFVELAWATWRRLGPEGCIDLAYRSQTRHLQRLRRLVNRASGPQALVLCTAKAWRRYHDTGRVRIHELLDDRSTISIDENPAILEPGYAEAVLGAVFALVRMGGTSRVSGTITRLPPEQALLEISWEHNDGQEQG